MDWIVMFAVWAIVELVQFMRKKPFPARMKAGAYWGAFAMALTLVGMQGGDLSGSWYAFPLSLVMCGVVAFVVYWMRIKLTGYWVQKNKGASS